MKKERDVNNEWVYLVKWTGYSEKTWEDAATLRTNALDILNAFNRKWSNQFIKGPKSKRKRQDD